MTLTNHNICKTSVSFVISDLYSFKQPFSIDLTHVFSSCQVVAVRHIMSTGNFPPQSLLWSWKLGFSNRLVAASPFEWTLHSWLFRWTWRLLPWRGHPLEREETTINSFISGLHEKKAQRNIFLIAQNCEQMSLTQVDVQFLFFFTVWFLFCSDKSEPYNKTCWLFDNTLICLKYVQIQIFFNVMV